MSARRLSQRRGAASDKPPTLNLVSLMDIFTILVFFLMVNANEVEVLETSTAIKLPDSISEDKPEERISIEVSEDALIVQGEIIASIEELLQSETVHIEPLMAVLTDLRAEDAGQNKVTIMGDRALPYELLKRVMASCQAAHFTRIALAVNQVSDGEDAA